MNTIVKNPTKTAYNKHKAKDNKNKQQNKIKPLFKNEKVFIIGGGGSLKNFNFELLRNKNIIVINKSFYYVSFAQVLYFSDIRFYQWYKEDIRKFNGYIFTGSNIVNDDKIINLKKTGRKGFDTKNGYIRHGGNSGYAAINLAYHLGSKEIILMGYDMKKTNNDDHFHDGYKTKPKKEVYNRFLENFYSLPNVLNKLNIKVYNTSLNSNLTIFEKRSIYEFL